jgi:predicted glycosyltransferase
MKRALQILIGLLLVLVCSVHVSGWQALSSKRTPIVAGERTRGLLRVRPRALLRRRRTVASRTGSMPLGGSEPPRRDLEATAGSSRADSIESALFRQRGLLGPVGAAREDSLTVRAREAEPRLLIYSQDGLGLGHLRRTTLLAAEFLSARPDASVLTISDSPIGRFFPMSAGHDYLKLPTIRKAGPGVWRPVALSAPFTDILYMRQQILRSAALSFKPDVLLVDHMPHGAMGELKPMLEALDSRGVRLVLGLRDILDAPSTVRRRWQLEGAFEAIEEHFELVLVYGSKDVFDVAAEYGLSQTVRSRLRYCGYVCPSPQRSPVEQIREHYLGGVEDGALVVAMAGGGSDAHHLFLSLLRAIPTICSATPCFFVVVTGPFLPDEERLELAHLARDLPVSVVPTVPDPLAFQQAADLIVAMAGYNTTAEILSLGKRALLVPRAGPSAEQRMRASRFAQRGWVRWLPPESLSPEAMSGAVLEALQVPLDPTNGLPDLGGRKVAASYLLGELAKKEADGVQGAQAMPGDVPLRPRDDIAAAG